MREIQTQLMLSVKHGGGIVMVWCCGENLKCVQGERNLIKGRLLTPYCTLWAVLGWSQFCFTAGQ